MNKIKSIHRENWDRAKADSVIKLANEVLHSKRKKVHVTEDEAYDAIKNTFAIVEDLFSGIHK